MPIRTQRQSGLEHVYRKVVTPGLETVNHANKLGIRLKSVNLLQGGSSSRTGSHSPVSVYRLQSSTTLISRPSTCFYENIVVPLGCKTGESGVPRSYSPSTYRSVSVNAKARQSACLPPMPDKRAKSCRSTFLTSYTDISQTGRHVPHTQSSSWNSSDQAQRLESEVQAVSRCRVLKRTSEVVPHRVDKLYYMCGATKKLHFKYHIDEQVMQELQEISCSDRRSQSTAQSASLRSMRSDPAPSLAQSEKGDHHSSTTFLTQSLPALDTQHKGEGDLQGAEVVGKSVWADTNDCDVESDDAPRDMTKTDTSSVVGGWTKKTRPDQQNDPDHDSPDNQSTVKTVDAVKLYVTFEDDKTKNSTSDEQELPTRDVITATTGSKEEETAVDTVDSVSNDVRQETVDEDYIADVVSVISNDVDPSTRETKDVTEVVSTDSNLSNKADVKMGSNTIAMSGEESPKLVPAVINTENEHTAEQPNTVNLSLKAESTMPSDDEDKPSIAIFRVESDASKPKQEDVLNLDFSEEREAHLKGEDDEDTDDDGEDEDTDTIDWEIKLLTGLKSSILHSEEKLLILRENTAHLNAHNSTTTDKLMEEMYSFVSDEQRDLFEEHFRTLDQTGNGLITRDQLQKQLFDNATQRDLDLFVKVFDLNRDNTVDLHEFTTVAALNDKLCGNVTTHDSEPLKLDLPRLAYHITAFKEMFEMADVDGDHTLGMEELMVIMTVGISDTIGTDQGLMDLIIDTVDSNHSGKIEFVEFLSFIPFFLRVYSHILNKPVLIEDIERARNTVRRALRPKQRYHSHFKTKTKDIWAD